MPASPCLPVVLAVLCAGLSLACADEGPSVGLATVEVITLRPAAATIEVGQQLRLTAVLHDAGGELLTDHPVTWSSSRPDVATVDEGLVTGLTNGEAEITAGADGLSASTRVTVRLEVARVLITPEAPTVVVGSSVQLKATALSPEGSPLGDRVVRWSTLAPDVASVSVGKVTGRRPGSAEIVATVDRASNSVMVEVSPDGGAPAPPASSAGF